MDSVAFHLGSLTVNWFGIFVAAAFVAGFWTASRRALRDGLAPEAILDAAPWLVIGSIFGARLLYVMSYWREEFAAKPFPAVFAVWNGGLVFYGGLAGGSLAMLIYVRRHRLPMWKVADAIAPSIALGHIFGRFGCLMNGCCYGQPTELPWALHFPAGHPTRGAGVHPTQLYEALLNLGLYGALAWLHRRKKFDGQVLAVYLASYAVLRALVEGFRGDYPVRYFGWATPGQLVSVGILAAGVVLYFALPRRVPKPA